MTCDALSRYRLFMGISWNTFGSALALASVHIVAGKLRFLDVTPRSVWLSGAGGASVAYVFLHILPDLAEGQRHFNSAVPLWLQGIERHVWLLALAGLAAFYGLERLVRQSRARQNDDGHARRGARGVFWLHIGSFALYNVLFGYLLARRETETKELILFSCAIGLHFVVNDYGLRTDHRRRYDNPGRWILSVAITAGWFTGAILEIHQLGVTAVFALLAGGIILNVLKEELPEQRRSRFSAFAAGAAAYSALLLLAG